MSDVVHIVLDETAMTAAGQGNVLASRLIHRAHAETGWFLYAPACALVEADRARPGTEDFDNGGSQVAGAPGNYTDSDSFEPRNAVKGDVARMILYMAVRYDGGDGFADLEPNDRVSNGAAPAIGRLSVLKQWSRQDPPDTFEKHRNDVIYNSYQHNRNPFIDHPEWVDAIW